MKMIGRGWVGKIAYFLLYCVILGLFVMVRHQPNVRDICPKISLVQERLPRDSNLKLAKNDSDADQNNEHENLIANDITRKVRYNHPLHPVFPLGEELAAPVPGHRIGKIEKASADIIVGIPTVKRDNISYLEKTLQSLYENMYADLQKKNEISVKIVVFIGEVDLEFVQSKMQRIMEEFPQKIASHDLEVISVPENYYPTNWDEVLHLQFGDTLERTKWRSKQNLDQVFLMMYIYNLQPKYYLMLEDDVIAKNGYANRIMAFATIADSKDWFYLSFCMLGAIGKLFRARTLPSYASFIHTFWNRKPLDWLQNDYVASQVCSYDKPHLECLKLTKKHLIEYRPSLFQHMGKVSSLTGKKQLLEDQSFKKFRGR